MRHGRRADFACLGALLEITDRNITPDIAIQIDQDGIGTGDRVEQLGHVIVRFDLDRVRIEFQSESLFYDIFGESFPVEIRVGRQVGIVIADCAVHLAQDFNRGNALHRPLQTRDDVGNFLAQRRRAGGLAVRARHHRQISVSVR